MKKLEYDVTTVSVERTVIEANGCRVTIGPFGEIKLYAPNGIKIGGREVELPKDEGASR